MAARRKWKDQSPLGLVSAEQRQRADGPGSCDRPRGRDKMIRSFLFRACAEENSMQTLEQSINEINQNQRQLEALASSFILPFHGRVPCANEMIHHTYYAPRQTFMAETTQDSPGHRSLDSCLLASAGVLDNAGGAESFLNSATTPGFFRGPNTDPRGNYTSAHSWQHFMSPAADVKKPALVPHHVSTQTEPGSAPKNGKAVASSVNISAGLRLQQASESCGSTLGSEDDEDCSTGLGLQSWIPPRLTPSPELAPRGVQVMVSKRSYTTLHTPSSHSTLSSIQATPKEMCPPENPWHRWSAAVGTGLPERRELGGKGLGGEGSGAGQEGVAMKRRQSAPSPPRQSTPAALSGDSTSMLHMLTPLQKLIMQYVEAARLVSGPGSLPTASTPDPNVAMLVDRLEAAVSDVSYYRRLADRHQGRGGRWGHERLSGAPSDDAMEWRDRSPGGMTDLTVQVMTFRLQSCSTAALTVSMDVCWCKAELASVMRALDDMCSAEEASAAHNKQKEHHDRLDQLVEDSIELRRMLEETRATLELREEQLRQQSAKFEFHSCLATDPQYRVAQTPQQFAAESPDSPLPDSRTKPDSPLPDSLPQQRAPRQTMTKQGRGLLPGTGKRASQGISEKGGIAKSAHDAYPSVTPPTPKGPLVQKLAAVFESGCRSGVVAGVPQLVFAPSVAANDDVTLILASERSFSSSSYPSPCLSTYPTHCAGGPADQETTKRLGRTHSPSPADWELTIFSGGDAEQVGDEERREDGGEHVASTASSKIRRQDSDCSRSEDSRDDARIYEHKLARLQEAHASTQDTLAALTRQFHAYRENAEAEIGRLKRQEAKARRREEETSMLLHETKADLNKKLKALDRELFTALGTAQDKSSLSAQLAEQTSMISSLQNKLRELAGSQDKSRVKALGTDLKDANRRLELALVSVNSEQERANAAEFEAHHEKEGRRYFRRCLKDVDAQLAQIAGAFESSVQKLTLSLARSLKPLFKEHELRTAALSGRSKSLLKVPTPHVLSSDSPYSCPPSDQESDLAMRRLAHTEEALRGVLSQQHMTKTLQATSGGVLISAELSPYRRSQEEPQTSRAASTLRGSKMSIMQSQRQEENGQALVLAAVEVRLRELVAELAKIFDEMMALRRVSADEALTMADNMEQTRRQLRLGHTALREAQKAQNAAKAAAEAAVSARDEATAEASRLHHVLGQVREAGIVIEETTNASSLHDRTSIHVRLPTAATPRDVEERFFLPILSPSKYEGINDGSAERGEEGAGDDLQKIAMFLESAFVLGDEAPDKTKEEMAESSTKAATRATRERRSISPVTPGGNWMSFEGGVVEESNSESVRAQVTLFEALTPGTSNARVSVGGQESLGSVHLQSSKSLVSTVLAGEGSQGTPNGQQDQLKDEKKLPESSLKDQDEQSIPVQRAPSTHVPTIHVSNRVMSSMHPVSQIEDGEVCSNNSADGISLPAPTCFFNVTETANSDRESFAEQDSARMLPSEELLDEVGGPDAATSANQGVGRALSGIRTNVIQNGIKVGSHDDPAGPNDGQTLHNNDEMKVDEQRAETTSLRSTAIGCPTFAETNLPHMDEKFPQVKKARALYAYDPLEDDELKLSADGELFVLGLAQPEWFVAVHAHRVPAEIGLVPENYVRILDQAEAFAPVSASSPAAPDEREADLENFQSENISKIDRQVSFDERKENNATHMTQDVLHASFDGWPDTPKGPPLFSRCATPKNPQALSANDIIQPSSTGPVMGAAPSKSSSTCGEDDEASSSSSSTTRTGSLVARTDDVDAGTSTQSGERSSEYSQGNGNQADTDRENGRVGIRKLGLDEHGCPRYDKADLPEMDQVFEVIKKARALYAYDPLEDDELKLSADGELFVLGLAQPEWFVAVHAHRVPAEIGLVPENYVRILDQAEAFAEAFF